MLSISPAKSAEALASYHAEHLVENPRAPKGGPEDYYSVEGPGQWGGPAAAALGLAGDVDARAFAAAALGLDPATGEALVQGANRPDRRAGHDLTFSAPKSVSAVWAVSDDRIRQAVQQAHDRAVAEAMSYIDDAGAVQGRRGKAGRDLTRERVDGLWATFRHGTSREQDPQLHSHVVLLNLGRRGDGTWGAIDPREIYRRQKAAGAIYRVALAERLREAGFTIERDGESFRIAGVPEALEKEWSKRRQQVEAALGHQTPGLRHGEAAERAALETRRKKEAVSTDELRARWQAEAAEHGLTASRVQDLAAGWAPEPSEDRVPQPMPEPADLWRELTERASTVSRPQIEATVFQRAQGIMSAADSRRWVDDFLSNPETVKLRAANGETRFTSREMLELEQALVDGARARQQEQHAVSADTLQRILAKHSTLSDEQAEMVRHVTGDAGVTAVQGRAGTGKSHALGVARRAWEADSREVIGCALAGKAAQGLEEGSGIRSQTLHSLLQELDEGQRQLSDRHVIVVDEAGMVGSRQMARLLDHASTAGAKVVLVGDSRQLQPVDAGGSFRGITAAIGAAELKDIRRQREHWQREAVAHFADGEAGRALRAYRDRGLLRTAPDHDSLVRQMVADWKQSRDPARPGESLMIAATRADVAHLNTAAREALADQLHGPVLQHEGKAYQAGDRVLFTRNSRALDVKNGTLGTVEHVDPEAGRLTVRTDDGRTVAVDLEQYQSIQHGYAITAHKAQGVTVDRTWVLVDERMSGREWSYVAASRAREQTTIYAGSDLVDELDQVMARSQQKDMAIDYSPEAAPAETDSGAQEIVSPTRAPERGRGFELEL